VGRNSIKKIRGAEVPEARSFSDVFYDRRLKAEKNVSQSTKRAWTGAPKRSIP